MKKRTAKSIGNTGAVIVDDSGHLNPVSSERKEGLEFSCMAAQIFSFPYELAISVQKSSENGKFAFGIVRDLYTDIVPIMKTTFFYESYEDAARGLEHTLRLIVRMFSDEKENQHTQMITTKVVDWIMQEVRAYRIAQTKTISPPVSLKN